MGIHDDYKKETLIPQDNHVFTNFLTSTTSQTLPLYLDVQKDTIRIVREQSTRYIEHIVFYEKKKEKVTKTVVV